MSRPSWTRVSSTVAVTLGQSVRNGRKRLRIARRTLAARVGVADAAAQLGVAPGLLYVWQGKAKQAGQGAKVEQAQAAEIARLKRQLADQAEELAILKKAAAYFARTSK